MNGFIHSIETFGSVDGPGIRYVVFMQGCPMRCLYCHNPDTWEIGNGREVSAQELIREYLKNKMFYRNGGITATGGEPLLQVDFLIELFSLAKAQGIHTCLDTSGITYSDSNTAYREKLDTLMQYTDLVMLDIKHIDHEKHRHITSRDNSGILAFARYLAEKGIPVWIRHVIVKGYTDDPEHLKALGRFIGGLSNVKALDVLPYHSMGEAKYLELGMEYPLSGMESLEKSDAEKAKNYILDGIREARRNKCST
jgi:pyruvate formate lyase activating enzyme